MSKISFLPVEHHRPDAFSVAKRPLGSNLEFAARFFGKKLGYITSNGRHAMDMLFRHLNLQLDDEIYITTTFGLPNLSSCVTCSVFNFCRPSRVLTDKTKLIFVIHEFGVTHPEMERLRSEADKRGIPLVEDCAHTIDTFYPTGKRVGAYADWIIVSFPKIFPVSLGGMLLGNEHLSDADDESVYQLHTDQFDIVFEDWRNHLQQDSDYRRALYTRIDDSIKQIDLKGFINLTPAISPWFMPIEVDTPKMSVKEFIEEVRRRGIDCGLWHGSKVTVLPLHQCLTTTEADSIASTVKEILSYS